VTVSSTVNLVISTGPAAVVPDLEGDNIAEARHALRAAGLVLGHVNPAAGPNGLIVAQAAKPGRRLVQGIPITVVVGVSPVGNSGT
jgi:beta-lactam-binding protein with PASTA domain